LQTSILAHIQCTDFFFLIAGGQAVDSNMARMLTVVPESIHDRSGIFLGSYDEVQLVIDIHKKHGISV
jgi:fructose-1,6-bisphosphatase I